MSHRIARENAQVTRRQIDLDKLAWDPERLEVARRELLDVERLAAREGEIAAARQALTDGRSSLTAAQADLDAIEEEGKAARAAQAAAQARVDEGTALRAQRDAARLKATASREVLASLETEGAGLTETRTRAQAALEQRDEHIAERDEVQATIARDEVELIRYRKLADAMGPTGIPARIIEGTIPELEGYVNEFLGELWPGWSVAFEVQRAKKSGGGVIETLDIIVRSDRGVLPYSEYSGGEQTSVSLALAVGLSRLIARRAGHAIRTLVIDEPDGLDAIRRRALGQLLKRLAHRGDLERIVVVTHTPDLAELGDAVYAVTRDGDGSHVELVA